MFDFDSHWRQLANLTIRADAKIVDPHGSIMDRYVVVSDKVHTQGSIGSTTTRYMSVAQFRTYREQMRAALDSVELPGDDELKVGDFVTTRDGVYPRARGCIDATYPAGHKGIDESVGKLARVGPHLFPLASLEVTG